MTVIHEILHALGFSQNNFAFYRDPNGAFTLIYPCIS